jgi:outer membrane protein assembly factor BamB
MTEAKAEECDSYTTPVMRKRSGREWEMLVWGGNQLDSYDPRNGKQLWFMPGLVGGRTVTGPTVFRDQVFVTVGMRGPLHAFKLQNPDKADDAAASGVVMEKSDEPKKLDRTIYDWRFEKGTPDSCTPVVWDKLLFTVNDDGVARCYSIETGNIRWQERLPDGYKSSPLAADGRIYFFNLKGKCTVISARSRFEKLTENELDDSFVASPAVSDGMIYIRGKKGLYGISKD